MAKGSGNGGRSGGGGCIASNSGTSATTRLSPDLMERGIGTTPAAGDELARVLPVQIMAPQAATAIASNNSMFFSKLMQTTDGVRRMNFLLVSGLIRTA